MRQPQHLLWYVRRQTGDKKGPFTAEQLRAAATQNKLLPTDLLWKEGFTDWVPAGRVNGLFSAVGAASAAPIALPPKAAESPPATADTRRPAKPVAKAPSKHRPSWQVALAIVFFAPLGLYWLYQHPKLRTDKRWWLASAIWVLFLLSPAARRLDENEGERLQQSRSNAGDQSQGRTKESSAYEQGRANGLQLGRYHRKIGDQSLIRETLSTMNTRVEHYEQIGGPNLDLEKGRLHGYVAGIGGL